MKKVMTIVVSILLTTELFAWTTPSLVSPSDGASQWTGLLFDWNAVSGSQQYQFQVDTSPSFNSPVLFNLAIDYINSSSGNGDTEHYLDNLFLTKISTREIEASSILLTKASILETR